MKGRTIAIGDYRGRNAAALVEDGRLEDLFIDGDTPAPGTIFRAICDRPVKGAGGMFVRLGDEGSGYLRQAKGLAPGQPILVQVTGYAEPGKAVPLTARVLFKSRYAIVTPGAPGRNVSRSIRDEEERVRLRDISNGVALADDMGLILRSQAAGAPEEDVLADIEDMVALAGQVMSDTGTGAERLLDGPDAARNAWIQWPADAEYDDAPGSLDRHGVTDMIDALRSPLVTLEGGASASIEATRALVAVDVNSGGSFSAAGGLKANLALARDLPRQLRLRGLGGQIVIDFAPMPKKDRRALENALKSAFRRDATETSLVGWTGLGLYEAQRKRERLPLSGSP